MLGRVGAGRQLVVDRFQFFQQLVAGFDRVGDLRILGGHAGRGTTLPRFSLALLSLHLGQFLPQLDQFATALDFLLVECGNLFAQLDGAFTQALVAGLVAAVLLVLQFRFCGADLAANAGDRCADLVDLLIQLR